MTAISLDNPLFATYTVAACLMVLKFMGQGWVTVFRMLRVGGGYASPEDLRPGLINTNPSPNSGQLAIDDYVDRSRRMHRNDTENIPGFLVAGLLFVLAEPSLPVAQVLLYGFVLARAGHAMAYATAQSHEMRAIFYTVGSCIVMGMAAWTLWTVAT